MGVQARKTLGACRLWCRLEVTPRRQTKCQEVRLLGVPPAMELGRHRSTSDGCDGGEMGSRSWTVQGVE